MNTNSLLGKISSIKIFNSIFNFLHEKKKYLIPFFISKLNSEFNTKIDKESNELINSELIKEKEKNELKKIISLNKFYINCNKTYNEYKTTKETYKDPLSEIYNKISKPDDALLLNYHKYFYYFLMNVPYINLSPFCSMINIIYFNEYYSKVKSRPKIANLILYLNDDIVKSRINDTFGEIVIKSNEYVIKNKKINFNCDNLMKIIYKFYLLYNEPMKIIVIGDNKNIEHNFKNKSLFNFDGILFKLFFKTNSLLIIRRV